MVPLPGASASTLRPAAPDFAIAAWISGSIVCDTVNSNAIGWTCAIVTMPAGSVGDTRLPGSIRLTPVTPSIGARIVA